MGGIISFFSVSAAIIILVVAALGTELALFLYNNMVLLAIIVCAIILIPCLIGLRKTEDSETRMMLISAPFCVACPLICLFHFLYEIFNEISGLNQIIAIVLELPMAECFIILLSLGVGWIAMKLHKEPALATVIVIIGTLLITIWACSLGM